MQHQQNSPVKLKFLGEVIWFNPELGFGFLTWKKNDIKQTDLFVHFSDIQVNGYKTLNKGQRVEFMIGFNYHQQPKAIEVYPIER